MARSASKSGAFDRFVEAASEFASHTAFFLACVLLVLVWILSYFVFGNLNTWPLVSNTATTIVTLLVVALLQNSQRRRSKAVPVTHLSSVWVAEHGWCYLQAAIDCCTREIVGWSLELRCRTDEAIDLVDAAIVARGIGPGSLTLGTDG